MKFVRVALIAMLLLVLGSMSVAAQPGDPFVASASVAVVDTEAGQLQGFVHNGVYTYLGVPYATAERFQMPAAVEPWEGVRGALTYGEICPFIPMDAVANDEMFNPHRYLPTNENCQFLNVWTPGIQDDSARPVMVWLHGGGWSNGSSIEQVAYDGANLAAKGDVVVVSLNHRLNVLGYLDLSAYGEEYKYSGNAGVADMVMALEWVQANIAEFGGDPDNVTIFGQSGGGGKVGALLTVPAADGLVDKAIIQSGTPSYVQPEVSRLVAEYTLANLGLDAESVAEIQTVPYLELLAAATEAIAQAEAPSWRPVIDGDYFPAPVFTEQANDIPLMIGSVMNEQLTVTGGIDPMELQNNNFQNWSEEETVAKLEERFGENGAAVAEAFAAAYPTKPVSAAYFQADRTSVLNTANLKAAQDAPVYNYIFTYFSPVMDKAGMAWHCSEIPYVFDNVDLVPQATGGDDAARAMAHTVSQAWINFARFGNPNHDGLPEWPEYSAEEGGTMVLDSVPWVGFQHDAELLSLMAQ